MSDRAQLRNDSRLLDLEAKEAALQSALREILNVLRKGCGEHRVRICASLLGALLEELERIDQEGPSGTARPIEGECGEEHHPEVNLRGECVRCGQVPG